MEPLSGKAEPPAATPSAILAICILVLTISCNSSPQKKPPLPAAEKKPATVMKPPLKAPSSKKKKLYLTFDDGPNKGTRNVLHIAQSEEVPVSFFIVGEHVFASTGQQQTWDSLKIAEHIALCSHSYTHAWHNSYNNFYSHPDSAVKDFARIQDSLQLTNDIVRTPGRNIWRIDSLKFTDLKKSAAFADSLQKKGYVLMGWDLEWHYNPKSLTVSNSAEQMANQIDSVFKNNKTRTPDNLVLLAHDQVYGKSADSFELRRLFQLLKQRDEYDFSLITDYPGATKQ